jgi:hypothetical protein
MVEASLRTQAQLVHKKFRIQLTSLDEMYLLIISFAIALTLVKGW